MTRKKVFVAPTLVPISTGPIPEEEGGTIVKLPENPTSWRILDLTPWLNKGMDEWVWACAGQLRAFIKSREFTPASVSSYCNQGILNFFEFLQESNVPCLPQSIERIHIETYIVWIKERHERTYTTQRNIYTKTKSVLNGLQRRSIVPPHRDLFPANPFPGARNQKGAMPLSPNERIRLAEALKKDLIAIHKKEFKGTEGEALIVHALFLAMRTGMNTTPMLELRRDCLKPHPFMPNMMLVESFKRRGNATQLKSLRYSREEHLPISIPMDGVGVLRKVLELTEAVVVEASKNHQKRLWLYRSKKNQDRGVVTVLTMSYMTQGILGLINRHCLHGDDGQPLGLSLSRLRKTLENRLWVLSNGDLFTVAAIMGHTPKIADSNYLVCTNEMRENATLLGEALPEIHRTGNAGDTNGKKVIPLNLQNTPVGSCKDSINGDKAPKNGDHCDNFFSCFSCRSYAIVGSSEDLHRLFSFYWFLDLERDRARTNEWRERFLHTMQLIDAFTVEKFDAAMVASAKEKARIHPIKFWQSYTMGTTESNHATV